MLISLEKEDETANGILDKNKANQPKIIQEYNTNLQDKFDDCLADAWQIFNKKTMTFHQFYNLFNQSMPLPHTFLGRPNYEWLVASRLLVPWDCAGYYCDKQDIDSSQAQLGQERPFPPIIPIYHAISKNTWYHAGNFIYQDLNKNEIYQSASWNKNNDKNGSWDISWQVLPSMGQHAFDWSAISPSELLYQSNGQKWIDTANELPVPEKEFGSNLTRMKLTRYINK